MILVRWRDRWFLTPRVQPHLGSCALLAGDWEGLSELGFMCREHTFERPVFGLNPWRSWDRRAPIDEVAFFPEVHYRGVRVHPIEWERNNPEPVLLCNVGDLWNSPEMVRLREELNREARGRYLESHGRHPATDPYPYRLWPDLVERLNTGYRRVTENVVGLGWKSGDPRDGLTVYAHVDEMEKIEGPPHPEEPI